MRANLIRFSVLLSTILFFIQQAGIPQSNDEENKDEYYSGAYDVGITAFIPSNFDLEMNPLWGGWLGWYSYVSGYSGYKVGLGVNYSALKEENTQDFSYSGSTMLVHGSIDYVFGSYPKGKLDGLFGYLGLGYAGETVTIKTRFLDEESEEEIKKDGLILEAGVGYFIKTGAIDVKYVYFTYTGNLEGAILVGIKIFVGKTPG